MFKVTNRILSAAITFGSVLLAGCAGPPGDSASPTFQIELSESAAGEIAALGLDVPVTGRAYVILSTDAERQETEPNEEKKRRFEIHGRFMSRVVFFRNVNNNTVGA